MSSPYNATHQVHKLANATFTSTQSINPQRSLLDPPGWNMLLGLLPFGLSSLLLSPHSYVFDSLKLLFIGTIIETVRRIFMWAFDRFRFQCCITAHFHESDPSFDWMIHFLTEEKVWKRSREFRVSAKSSKRQWAVGSFGSQDSPSRQDVKQHAEYVPTYDVPQLFRWRNHLLEIHRNGSKHSAEGFPGRGASGTGSTISVTIYSLHMSLLSDLVEEARAKYLNVSHPYVIVHTADSVTYGAENIWGSTKNKTKRPLESIILPDDVLPDLIADAKEFLETEDWYIQAGIPHRRGYLLHGPPGTGKSSTIYALAGELGMEIYSLSLSSGFVDDGFLERAASAVPKNSIFLLEDIDCAFPSREETEALESGVPLAFAKRSPVSLSGLLNVIDGCGAEEGKLFFATTNYMDRIDPALLRPGRIDRKIEYRLATHEQASALFLRFFPRSCDVSQDSIKDLAETFASQVPADEFSTAELQGFLLGRKRDPLRAVDEVAAWVSSERLERKEKAAREEEKSRRLRERREVALRERFSSLPLTHHNGFPAAPAYPGMLTPLPLMQHSPVALGLDIPISPTGSSRNGSTTDSESTKFAESVAEREEDVIDPGESMTAKNGS